MVMVDLQEKVTFEHRLEHGARISFIDVWGKDVLGIARINTLKHKYEEQQRGESRKKWGDWEKERCGLVSYCKDVVSPSNWNGTH